MKNKKNIWSTVLLILVLIFCGVVVFESLFDKPVVSEEHMKEAADFTIMYTVYNTSENAQAMYDYYSVEADEQTGAIAGIDSLQQALDQGIQYEDGSVVKLQYYDARAFLDALSSYTSAATELGAMKQNDLAGSSGFSYDYSYRSGWGKVTQVIPIQFENREARITIVYDRNGNVTSASVDAYYSLGEILKKAGINTLLGMGSVFAILILISLIIALLPKFTGLFDKKKAAAPKTAPAAISEKAAAPDEEEYSDDMELVAVITAAIAAYEGTSSDGFTVRSIRRSSNNKWKRA